MKALAWRIARWFGVDGNPLRRRTDKIESAFRILMVLAFAVGAPLLAGTVGHSVRVTSQREVGQQRSWHEVNAVLLRSTPQPYYAYGSMATFWVPGRWQTPSGGTATGRVPAPAGASAGATVAVWVNGAGQATAREPMTSQVVVFRVVLAEVAVVAGLAIGLLISAGLIRWQLNRRRLAYWGIEWSAFGPRWTSRR